MQVYTVYNDNGMSG